MWNIAGVTAVQHPAFLVRAEPDNGTLRVFGELDADSATHLLIAATERLHCYQSITVDLADLMSINTDGLDALVALRDRCRASGTSLCVTGSSDRIAAVFAAGGHADMIEASPLATVTSLSSTTRQQASARAKSLTKPSTGRRAAARTG